MARRQKTAHPGVNWQELGAEFRVGDVVSEVGHPEEFSGRVVAVYPAIGMIDVQFPRGNVRLPVEDTVRWQIQDTNPPQIDGRPGGGIGVAVSGGPNAIKLASVRVAKRYLEALYWASKDRKYRATRGEKASGRYLSPRAAGVPLVRKPYKRKDGQSETIHICPQTLFIIKDSDILVDSVDVSPQDTDSDYEDYEAFVE